MLFAGKLSLILCAMCAFSATAFAQTPLRYIDDDTRVKSVEFRFVSSETFEESLLKEQILTDGPGFWDKVKKVLPFLSAGKYPFDPVELQKDVVRLRAFYRQNGFLDPTIDYRASQLDTSANTIRVIFAIEEGPPLLIQDVGFFAPGGDYAYYQLPPDLQDNWIGFRDDITVRTGDRYTALDRLRITDQVVRWLQNQGYAFASVDADVDTDSVDNVVDLSFVVDPGPLGRFDPIVVEGEGRVSERVIRRELPFNRGDRFDLRRLTQGQRELFALNAFRVALTEIPDDQPRDSTVGVLVRVREAKPRYVTAQTGYGRTNGVSVEGQWTHRNFIGGARTFTVSAIAQTGFGAALPTGSLPARLFRTGVSLRQPYIYSTKLSGTISPFVQYEYDPQVLPGDDWFGINTRQLGANASLLYEFFPYRTATAQYAYTRVLLRNRVPTLINPDSVLTDNQRDPFNRSILSTSAVLGRADNYIDPTNGLLFRPYLELGGAFLGSDIEYFKIGSEVTTYRPIRGRIGFAGRLAGGKLWPFGYSKNALTGSVPVSDSLRFENRFDPILFYAGGPTLRGWVAGQAGPKDPRVIARRNARNNLIADTLYEARGGYALLGGNAELRMPFPGLGPAWSSALFFDAAMIGDDLTSVSDVLMDIGTGIRYKTPVGFIRIDVAYKLNPSFEDLRDPNDVLRYRQGNGDKPDPQWMNRINLQLSIGQAF